MFLEKLEKYYEDKLLTKQVHPVYDLTIWNYSTKVQVENLWDDITLQCRGLITNSEGKIIARCVPKFFNIEEHKSFEIPNEPYDITEKMDGSYLNIFQYDDKWLVSSRGSFTSDQAVWGTELLKQYNTKYGLIPGWSYVAELIVPENRIVVDYGNDRRIVIITTFNLETGEEGSIDEMFNEGFDIVKKLYISRTSVSLPIYYGVTDLKKTIRDDQEGFVLKFKSGFRVKVKGEEYFRLHSIITGTSSRTIWELAKEGKSLDDILIDVPDEFYSWAKNTYADFIDKFESIKKETDDEYWSLIDRKEYALKIKDKKYKHLLFKRLTSHSNRLNDMIWDILYPEYFNPFSNTTKEDE